MLHSKKIFSSFRGAMSSYSIVTVIFLPKKKGIFVKAFLCLKKKFHRSLHCFKIRQYILCVQNIFLCVCHYVGAKYIYTLICIYNSQPINQ